jgi:group I intron endonuclease
MRPIILNKSGIYKIENKITGDLYIGQASLLWKRKSDHLWKLKQGIHPNKHLQCAWNKYGGDNFAFIPILLCDKENLTYYEQICVDNLKPHYNKQLQCVVSNLGIKWSDESKQKLSIAQKGKTISEEHRKKISESLTGIKRSDETKRKESLVRKNPSMETRRKIAEAAHNISDETREKRKISLAITNATEETKNKRHQAWLGKHHTEESKTKISKNRRGKGLGPRPEDVKQRISASITDWHKKRRESENQNDL